MAKFITRVELHGALEGDYDRLHREMGLRKFTRTIVSDQGDTYRLPSAEYFLSSELSVTQVRNLASEAATATGRGHWVLTSQYEAAAWVLKKE